MPTRRRRSSLKHHSVLLTPRKLSNNMTRRRSHRRVSPSFPKQCEKTFIVRTLLNMLRLVKIFHWNTKSYSQHKATDDLYERMDEKIDHFVECYMGKDGKRLTEWNHHMELMYGTDAVLANTNKSATRVAFQKYVHTFREFLINLDRCLDPTRDSDLLNIRDDLLGDVNQFLYLYTLH